MYCIYTRNLKNEHAIIVGGDGQMDSPGHSAKHCVYSLMDTVNYYILHIQNIDVRQSQYKSSVMEKIGCEQALSYLMSKVNVTEFVSDANSQIIKMLSKCSLTLYRY